MWNTEMIKDLYPEYTESTANSTIRKPNLKGAN
jgi:hypothetical protein